MKYFQIRISQHLSLEEFLKQLSDDICLKLRPFFPLEKNSDDDLLLLQESIQSTLKEELQKFPNCGLAAECHEEIEGGPWLDYSDKIYMLYVEDTFEQLVDYTSSKIVNGFFYDIEHEQRLKLSTQMSIVLRHELAKHLYFNSNCRVIPFCELQL
ncbi:MAG TPA: hypothetical protein VLH08_16385 [Acidobacteriota bacterium]|nr:hypothetical protein [Acidobacteriota bacterium]